MIQITDFSFGYGKKYVLRNLNMTVKAKSLNALIGLNGVGKSTLFACLSKQYRSSHGSIFVKGRDICAYTYREYAQTVSFVPQVSAMSQTDNTVRNFLVSGRTPYLSLFSVPGKSEYAFMGRIAEKVGADHLLDKNFLELSGGQQQLISLTRALVQDTPIILLDEPMSALDLRNQAFMLNLIKELSDKGKTILFSTHDPNHALMLNCNVMLLKNGSIICEGAANSCLSNKYIQEIYGDDVEVLNHENRRICTLVQ